MNGYKDTMYRVSTFGIVPYLLDIIDLVELPALCLSEFSIGEEICLVL
ncbi:MAG: hypothetical protein LBB88_06090 [Planctomycetaceae bacterium]|nr:hypothetical protein [Planctomycetaceae bacterium]